VNCVFLVGFFLYELAIKESRRTFDNRTSSVALTSLRACVLGGILNSHDLAAIPATPGAVVED